METQKTLFGVTETTTPRKNKRSKLIFEIGAPVNRLSFTEGTSTEIVNDKYFEIKLCRDTKCMPVKETYIWTMRELEEIARELRIPIHWVW